MRSSALLGSATFVSLLAGLLRMKVLALLVGPEGIGLFGLLNVLLTTGAAVAGLNIGVSGVQHMSSRQDGSVERFGAEAAVVYFSIAAAAIGATGFLVLRSGELPTGTIIDAQGIWIALAIALSILNAVQVARLQSYGRIAAIARIGVVSAVLASVGGIAAVTMAGTAGVAVAVFLIPFCAFALAFFYSRQLPAIRWQRLDAEILSHWKTLVALGLAVSIAGWVGQAGQLGIRAILAREGGLSTVGLFQAAYILTNANMTLVMAAVGVQYLPRLSAVAADPARTSQVANEQLAIIFLLAGLPLIGATAAAPWIIPLFYSSDFARAVPLFQWQIVADVSKMASWVLGYVLIVRRSTIGIVAVESVFDALFLGSTWALFDSFGLLAAAAGYGAGIAGSIVATLAITLRSGITLDRANWTMLAILTGLGATTTLASAVTPVGGAAVGCLAAAIFFYSSWRQLGRLDSDLTQTILLRMRRFR